MSTQSISPDRWDTVWAADLDVLRGLRENGDRPEIVRDVDVSFRGSFEALKSLASACGDFGFVVDELLEANANDEPWLVLVRAQTTDEQAIRELTHTYLGFEDKFGVECDGWGCINQNEANKRHAKRSFMDKLFGTKQS